MAKTDVFFIRAAVSGDAEVEIDLGAFVDALGKSVLRIHSVSVAIQDVDAPNTAISLNANEVWNCTWQITTQTQTGAVDYTDKSMITHGNYYMVNANAINGVTTAGFEVGDRVDQSWSKGYLVAVEQIFLRAFAAAGTQLSTGDAKVSVILECTVETLTKESAMALALSQQ
jgi:hypothetical protein